MVLSSVILDEGMVYFDARLSQHYPTVEVRAADVCFTVEEAIVVAALCRGLVETAAQRVGGRHAGARRADPDAPARDVAGRAGGARGAASSTGAPGCRRRAGRCSRRSSTTWGPALEAAGDLEVVQEGLARVREEGNGAIRQRAMLARTGRLVDVVAESVRETSSRVAG